MKIQQAMASIWAALVPETKKTVSLLFLYICLAGASENPLVRLGRSNIERKACCSIYQNLELCLRIKIGRMINSELIIFLEEYPNAAAVCCVTWDRDIELLSLTVFRKPVSQSVRVLFFCICCVTEMFFYSFECLFLFHSINWPFSYA